MEHDVAFNAVYPFVQEDVQDTKPSSRRYRTLSCSRDRAWKDMRSNYIVSVFVEAHTVPVKLISRPNSDF